MRDGQLFDENQLPRLRVAVAELSWLLSRCYQEKSALKLVGDRHGLEARQRKAVRRCSCSDEQLARRMARRQELASLPGGRLTIDGFNLLILVQSAAAGQVVLRGRDGCLRDLASVHGGYRLRPEAERAVFLVGQTLAALRLSARWLLDRPVAQSGLLRRRLLELAADHGWDWTVALEQNPDQRLAESTEVVASSDGWVLDRCQGWTPLAAEVIQRHLEQAWLLPLG